MPSGMTPQGVFSLYSFLLTLKSLSLFPTHVVRNNEGALRSHYGDDVKADGGVEFVKVQVVRGSEAQVAQFLFVDCRKCGQKVLTRARLHLYKNQFAVTLGNNVEFPVTVAPVALQQGVTLADQITTGLFFSYLSEDVVGSHVRVERLKVKGER